MKLMNRLALCAVCLCQPLQAADSLSALLQQVRSTVAADAAEDQRRLQQFQSAQAQQEKLLQQARQRLAAAEQQQARLTQVFTEQEEQLSLQGEALRNRSGQLGEVFGVVKQHAQEFQGVLKDSMISAQLPARDLQLQFADSKRIPTFQQMETLWLLLQEEMTATAQVVKFQGPVVRTDGHREQQEIIRVGPFTAINAQGEYLSFQPDSGYLRVLVRQPGSAVVDNARAFFRGDSINLLIDPSRGNLLQMLAQTPGWQERISQGGVVGYIILILGTVGAGVAAWRLLNILMTNFSVRRQLTLAASPCNPLGRILLAARQATTRDDMELRIEEALLGEASRLEQGLTLLKLLAAVAPLLGLLGTVTGMIGTFQSITLFGTGDPKMMAGGISQALMTTVLGLCVAIPLLFCHSILATRVRHLLMLLQQRSLAQLLGDRDAPESAAAPQLVDDIRHVA